MKRYTYYQNINESTTSISIPTCITAAISPPKSYIIHYPDWYLELIRSNTHDKVFKKTVSEKDWITPSMREKLWLCLQEEVTYLRTI